MIIGLGFKARCGKDTVADYLVDRHGYQKRAFAGSLKEACGIIFQLDHDQLHGELKGVEDPFWGATPRYILQQVGTEAMRKGFDENVWVDSWHRYIQAHGGDQFDWVVPDVRFPNEAEAIHKLGGKVVLIRRRGREQIDGPRHASETSMEGYEGWDYTLDNHGAIEDLHEKIEEMLRIMEVQNAHSISPDHPWP